jgi:predicted site-specific integrase-resolvase
MLRIKQVIERYHVCRATVYNWIKQGLPIIKVGKITFIEEKEIEKFIKKGE